MGSWGVGPLDNDTAAVWLIRFEETPASQRAAMIRTTLASAGDQDRMVKLWDVATGRERASLPGHTDRVYSVAFNPDGKLLASGSFDKTVKLWDVATRQERATLRGHTDWVWCVAFSPDGRTLASGGCAMALKLWDVSSGKERATLEGQEGVICVAFSPDGNTLASGSLFYSLCLWDVPSGERRFLEAPRWFGETSVDHPSYVAFSPTGAKMSDGLRVPGAHDGMRSFQFEAGDQLRFDGDLDQNRVGEDPGDRFAASLHFLWGYRTGNRQTDRRAIRAEGCPGSLGKLCQSRRNPIDKGGDPRFVRQPVEQLAGNIDGEPSRPIVGDMSISPLVANCQSSLPSGDRA